MGLLSTILGENNPAAQFAGSNHNWLSALGSGLASGPTFQQGLSNAVQMGPQGQKLDDAYAVTQKAEKQRQDGINATVKYLQSNPAFAHLVPLAQAGDGATALAQAFKMSTPGYGEQTVSPGQTLLGADNKPIYTAPQTDTAPSGYRFTADGQTLEPIPLGPADPNNPLNVNKVVPTTADGAPLGTTGNSAIDPSAPDYSSKTVVSGLTQAAIDQKALGYLTSGTNPPIGRSGLSGAQSAAIANRMAEIDPTGNLAKNKTVLKSLSESLAAQQKQLDSTQRSMGNAEAGFQHVVDTFQGKVNTSQYPTINAAVNAAKSQLSPGDIAAFKAGLTEVGNEYTQVFSRGGQVTDAVRNRAADVINGNLSISDLQKVLDELQAQGAIVVKGAQDQVKTITDQVNGIAGNRTQAAAPVDYKTKYGLN